MKRFLLVIATLGLGACLLGCPSSSSSTKGQAPKVDPKMQFPPGVAAPVKADPAAKSGGAKPGAGEKETPAAPAPAPAK